MRLALLGAIWLALAPLEQDAMGSEAVEEGFVSIFNGRDLSGWEGDRAWWGVEEGAITAQSTPDKPCTRATYLMWRDGRPGDFEMRLEYRLVGGNSGVQFRSREIPDWDTRGYQADIDAAGEWTGALFEHARGGVALRGERVAIGEDGRRSVERFADPAELLKHVDAEGWNSYRIVAMGEEISLFINDRLMSQASDRQRDHAARRGVIALQMHPGPPMKIEFRNLRIRIDDAADATGR